MEKRFYGHSYATQHEAGTAKTKIELQVLNRSKSLSNLGITLFLFIFNNFLRLELTSLGDGIIQEIGGTYY